jgi:3-deoxy-D-manno-octulosonic-acid transferase
LRLGQLLLDIIYLSLAPLVLLVLSRGFARAKYRRGFREKLGSVPVREGDGPSFWVHAVSVGEVLTSLPLLGALRKRYPGWDVSLSVSTYTGLEVARKKLPETTVFYAPFDLSFAVSRVYRRRRPSMIVLVELELWPNLLLEARRRGVPVLVANGRITERSSRRYAAAGRLARSLFGLVQSFGAQGDEYRARFLRLGVDPRRVEVLGNLKHDRTPPPLVERAEDVRQRLGWEPAKTLVLVAGSTHPGEEEILCNLYREVRREEPRLRLVLALRHVERIASLRELPDWGAGEALVRWSGLREAALAGAAEQASLLSPAGALVVDTVGELELFYALADVVFVGGSLIPHGGHNLFEAASLGRPLLFGSHFDNFREEGNLLLAEEAAVCVSDPSELRPALERLLADPGERRRLGERARSLTERLRGATGRHIEWIDRQLRLSLPARG